MKPQQVLSPLALVCISLGIALGLAEVGVRLLERFDLLAGNPETAVFPEVPYRGQYRPSKNKRLLTELDPNGPLVNADGFRDRDYPIERSDALRIVAIGDSVTFGRGVPLEEAWSEVLEERLNSGPAPKSKSSTWAWAVTTRARKSSGTRSREVNMRQISSSWPSC